MHRHRERRQKRPSSSPGATVAPKAYRQLGFPQSRSRRIHTSVPDGSLAFFNDHLSAAMLDISIRLPTIIRIPIDGSLTGNRSTYHRIQQCGRDVQRTQYFENVRDESVRTRGFVVDGTHTLEVYTDGADEKIDVVVADVWKVWPLRLQWLQIKTWILVAQPKECSKLLNLFFCAQSGRYRRSCFHAARAPRMRRSKN